jgi:hypothetical protein
MNDLSAYHITHTAAERAHIHIWGSTVHVFPLLLGGDVGGVGRPSDFLFAIYPTSRYLCLGILPARRFYCCEHEYTVFFLGRVIITYVFRRLRLNGGICRGAILFQVPHYSSFLYIDTSTNLGGL